MTEQDLKDLLAECEKLLARDRLKLAAIQEKEQRDIADCVASKASMPNNHWVERNHLDNRIRALIKLRDSLTEELGIKYDPGL